MLYSQDYDFLNQQILLFKESLFQLVSDFGPKYQARFMISFNDIRTFAGRTRLTSITLQEYKNYLEKFGFIVEQNFDFLTLFINAKSVITVGNESIKLANALQMFRARAGMHGDFDNI